MEALVHQRESLALTLQRQRQNFEFTWVYISSLFVNRKEIFEFKVDNKNINFPPQFCLGIISDEFGATESRQASLKRNVSDDLVDYNAIDTSDILNIHKHLMVKNNTK